MTRFESIDFAQDLEESAPAHVAYLGCGAPAGYVHSLPPLMLSLVVDGIPPTRRMATLRAFNVRTLGINDLREAGDLATSDDEIDALCAMLFGNGAYVAASATAQPACDWSLHPEVPLPTTTTFVERLRGHHFQVRDDLALPHHSVALGYGNATRVVRPTVAIAGRLRLFKMFDEKLNRVDVSNELGRRPVEAASWDL